MRAHSSRYHRRSDSLFACCLLCVCILRYAPIAGEPEFAKHAVALAFGADSSLIAEKRIAAIQSVSGTGALRLVGAYLNRFWPEVRLLLLFHSRCPATF
jgi:hypothetical protein